MWPARNGLGKNVGCHSGFGGVAFPQSGVPIGGGGARGEAKLPGGSGGGSPHGPRALSDAVGRPGEAPFQLWPTTPGGAAVRRAGVDTTSSSSAASADEPRVPFGLGERRLGEPEPDLVSAAAGRAIGARTGRATGPGSAADMRRLAPGARFVGSVLAEAKVLGSLEPGPTICDSPPKPMGSEANGATGER